ncbi:MAG: hypothetical protein ACFNX0_02000 [Treponema sp.]
MGTINPNDVTKIARKIVQERKLPPEMEMVIANILWYLISPKKESWKEKPHDFKNDTPVVRNDVDKIAKTIVQSRNLPQKMEQGISNILLYLISLEEKDLRGI